MDGMAKYEIGARKPFATVRYFIRPRDAENLTAMELEAREVIRGGFAKNTDVTSGRTDPFKAAESILADHYGYAKMVEADYEWRPRIRY